MAAPDDLFAVMDRLVAASQAVHDAYKEARATDASSASSRWTWCCAARVTRCWLWLSCWSPRAPRTRRRVVVVPRVAGGCGWSRRGVSTARGGASRAGPPIGCSHILDLIEGVYCLVQVEVPRPVGGSNKRGSLFADLVVLYSGDEEPGFVGGLPETRLAAHARLAASFLAFSSGCSRGLPGRVITALYTRLVRSRRTS
jgi:hypothetical protein